LNSFYISTDSYQYKYFLFIFKILYIFLGKQSIKYFLKILTEYGLAYQGPRLVKKIEFSETFYLFEELFFIILTEYDDERQEVSSGKFL